MMIAGSNAPVDGSSIEVKVFAVGAKSGLEADATAFLVQADGKVSSDDDMIFYGQPAAKDDVVRHSSSQGVDSFAIDLARLPASIEKIAFTLTIHEATQRSQSFANLTGARIELAGTGLEFAVETAGRSEAAMIMGELYRRNGQWKFRAVGQGFNGGLQPLAESFGVKVESSPTPASAPAASVVDLRKKKTVDLQKRDPELGRSAEQALVSLEKKGQGGLRAKVALVLDISGSMDPLYRRGSMDDLVRRLVALGFQVDDDGDIDVFLFGKNAYYFGTVQEGNYKSFTTDMRRQYSLEGGTMYGEAFELVRSHYRGRTEGLPCLVLFVTDGGTQDVKKSETQIVEAAREPIFWQFVAIGEHGDVKLDFKSKRLPRGFDFLQYLDDMPGRVVDNASFFAVADPRSIPDNELYDKMFEEFPDWLKAAKAQGILS